MKYIINKGTSNVNTRLLIVFCALLGIICIFLLIVALRCSETARERIIKCDEVSHLETGGVVCEVFLRPGVGDEYLDGIRESMQI